MGRFKIKRQVRVSENYGQRLKEVEHLERYLGRNGIAGQHVFCIHCGLDYLLEEAFVDSDDLVKCASLLCDGSLMDMIPVKEERLESMRVRYGFTEPADSAPL